MLGQLYAALALLTLANAADLYLTVQLVLRHGIAVEINPLMHIAFVEGGIPAFVGAKLIFSVAEVALALWAWRHVRPQTRGEERLLFAGLWLCAWWTCTLAALAALLLTR